MSSGKHSPAARAIPERLGRYQVLGHLATGGMAEILLARLDGPGGFQRVVVLKRVLPHLARKSELRAMFLDEARIVASLRHTNVVQVSELGRDNGELFLVMEYLEGESLARVLRKVVAGGARGLDFALSAHVIASACAGLHAAHEYVADGVPQKLVHRDVSPQNLFVTYDGTVKVLDFGVAKATDRYTNTSTGQVKGKFAYMSPEQCLAQEVDRRTDVFALGVVLWEISTGERLFTRDNELLVLKAICEDPIPRPSEVVPDYPPALEAIVMRALARKADDRYATAAEMRRDLLVAARDLAPAQLAEDELAALMQRLFAERIAQKAELLRQVGAGEDVGGLEWLEGDSSVDVDTSDLDGTRSGTRESAVARLEALGPEAAPDRPRRGAIRWLAAGPALAVAGVAGFATVLLIDPAPEASEPRAAEETVAPPAPVEAPAPPTEPTRAASPAATEAPPSTQPTTITLDLDSTPSGARVVVEGEERGTTPLALELLRGEEALEVGLSLEGYAHVVERVTPDVNQRLRVQLVRAPRRGRGTVRAPAGQPTKSGGFYRFD